MKIERLQQIIKPLEKMLGIYGFIKEGEFQEIERDNVLRGTFVRDNQKVRYYLHVSDENQRGGLYHTRLKLIVNLSERGETRELFNEDVIQDICAPLVIQGLVRGKIRCHIPI